MPTPVHTLVRISPVLDPLVHGRVRISPVLDPLVHGRVRGQGRAGVDLDQPGTERVVKHDVESPHLSGRLGGRQGGR